MKKGKKFLEIAAFVLLFVLSLSLFRMLGKSADKEQDRNTVALQKLTPVIVEVLKPANGSTYSDVNVYVKTTGKDAENTYLRYQYSYCKDDRKQAERNTRDNCDDYRISWGDMVSIKEYNRTKLKTEYVCGVLGNGGMEIAVKETGTEDFVGAFHGSEKMTDVKMFVDGKRIGLCSPGLYYGNVVEMIKDSKVYRDCTDTALLEHNVDYVFTCAGLDYSQSVKWLTDGTDVTESYVGMLPVRRFERNNGKVLADTVKVYDADGNMTGSATVQDTTPIQGMFVNAENRKAVFTGQNDVTVTVGFRMPEDAGATVRNVYVSVRSEENGHDLKWFQSFKPIEGDFPKAGDVWKVDSYIRVEYGK